MRVLFYIWAFFVVSLARADDYLIGIPEYKANLSWLDDRSGVAELIRALTTEALFARPAISPASSDAGVHLKLAQSFRVNADFSLWSFELKPGSVFSNGEEIEAEDVLFSLKRCSERGLLPHFKNAFAKDNDGIFRKRNPSVEVQVEGESEERKTFAKGLSDCPILHSESSLVFGSELGKGTNLVGSGQYRISSVKEGHEVRLLTGGTEREDAKGSVTFTVIDSSEKSLELLQSGKLDAFFTSEQSVLSRAVRDETLKVEKCSDSLLVARRSSRVSCYASEKFVK